MDDWYKELEKKRREDPYGVWPLTIIKDRYNGSYSGGRYLAFNQHEIYIPDSVSSGDNECMDFWHEWKSSETSRMLIGLGETPNDALIDLHKKLLIQ